MVCIVGSQPRADDGYDTCSLLVIADEVVLPTRLAEIARIIGYGLAPVATEIAKGWGHIKVEPVQALRDNCPKF